MVRAVNQMCGDDHLPRLISRRIAQVRFIHMPTNVTPEYKKAEEAYRKAREPRERLDCLKELLRTIR